MQVDLNKNIPARSPVARNRGFFVHEHNSWLQATRLRSLAMDNEEGLFVPVIHNAATLSDSELRSTINQMKDEVGNRSIAADKLKGATITLSNFGKFSGRFASPIIVPPMVAILAVGKLYKGVVAGKDNNIEIHKLLPLSLSFDHRAVTGGEATRFLGAVIEALQ